MSSQAPGGGAVHLRACSTLPSCTSWSRKAGFFFVDPCFFQLKLVMEEKKNKQQTMELRL